VLRCSALKHCATREFPLSDAKRLKKWIHQTRLKAWKPTKSSRLCSEHFEEKYLITPSTGRGIRLRNDAIPTIFSFPSQFQKKVICELISAVSTRLKKTPSYLNHSIWHPSRFHDDYCIPQVQSTYHIKEKWEWLTMEVKGPFPETQIGHRFVLTVMDYYSKWLEAYPMKTCTSKEIAQIISDLISRFGFPVGILCCLGVMLTVEVRDTVVPDLLYNMHVFCFNTFFIIYLDRLVSDLVKEHPDRWDVYLAASVFSFCCKEHPTTRQIPLSLLRCGGTQSVSTSPRKLPVSWRLIVFRLTVFKLHLDCVSLIK
uniref:THAP-type domain-containing protein n=1 Tax=Oncorhynchus mykiss TaxID=8022 RepID=A0A8K9X932_ONCMY